jgi:hypothetical protein
MATWGGGGREGGWWWAQKARTTLLQLSGSREPGHCGYCMTRYDTDMWTVADCLHIPSLAAVAHMMAAVAHMMAAVAHMMAARAAASCMHDAYAQPALHAPRVLLALLVGHAAVPQVDSLEAGLHCLGQLRAVKALQAAVELQVLAPWGCRWQHGSRALGTYDARCSGNSGWILMVDMQANGCKAYVLAGASRRGRGIAKVC